MQEFSAPFLRYAKTIIFVVFSYCILTVPVAGILSAYLADQNATVPAICISTQVGPAWFASYQPIIQMGCGLLSVLIYVATWYFYRKQVRYLLSYRQSYCYCYQIFSELL